ncbi:hypothetical protein [Paenibacillus sp. KN14-4R]|uniref:hypothetical protein n=1 Tax=Paenibacillus sp. KN14-4R TaxID=3445773 RepID=UPI003FA1940A
MILREKRKIRGWKRLKKRIEKWKQRVINLDIDHLIQYQRDYAKLWIHPFYAIPRRTPPTWYNRLLLDAVFDVYFHWHERMKSTNGQFYLKIWLFDPHFINTQIVVANKDALHFYDNTFDTAIQDEKFPFQKFTYLKEKIEKYTWKLHIDSDVYTESDLINDIKNGWRSEKEIQKVMNKAYKSESINLPNNEFDRTFSVKVGNVWIGSLKSDD